MLAKIVSVPRELDMEGVVQNVVVHLHKIVLVGDYSKPILEILDGNSSDIEMLKKRGITLEILHN
jgi:hypothetical protein